MSEYLLEINELSASFQNVHTHEVLDGVTLKVRKGEIAALVGESGCGKTMTALSLTRLAPRNLKITSGEVIFDGMDLLKENEESLRQVRGKKISYIFQEPSTALNPVLKIKDQMLEALRLHKDLKGKPAIDAATELLRSVGIPAASQRLEAYPHELSIGMKQRVMIALAISANPKLLVADEPTTALDATIQSGILNLLKRLRDEKGISVLLITHDLSVVEKYADFVFVMYKGRILECAPSASIFQKPIHPYTANLLSCVPKPGHYKEPLETLAADMTSFELKSLPRLSEVETKHWARIQRKTY